MDRRKFIKEGGSKLGVLTIGSGILLSGSCDSRGETAYNTVFSNGDVRLINELGDVILPPTEVPGAKAAQVGQYIALIVQDCYAEEDAIKFKRDLADLNTFSRETYNRSFLDCSEQERIELVSIMEEQHEGYHSIKSLIVAAYLSSEIGRTQLFDYYPVPSRYDGCTSKRPW